MDSILQSVKKDLGIAPEYTHFDQELITNINSVLSVIRQLGVGPQEGFRISDDTAVWTDLVDASDERLEYVKTYVSKRVKLLFDPPLNSSVLESTKAVMSELEWRMNVDVDHYISDAERAAMEESDEEEDGDG
jgi:hypothetical protein